MFDYIHGEAFRSHALDLMNRHHCPGVAIAIVDDGVTGSTAFGLAAVDPAIPCTPATIFDIASSSKALTAASIALLVADSNFADIQWDALMVDLLTDDFELSDSTRSRTLRLDDLVGHTTGVPRYVTRINCVTY